MAMDTSISLINNLFLLRREKSYCAVLILIVSLFIKKKTNLFTNKNIKFKNFWEEIENLFSDSPDLIIKRDIK